MPEAIPVFDDPYAITMSPTRMSNGSSLSEWAQPDACW